MARLVYRAAARRDLADIAAYIEDESQSRAAADGFIGKLMDYCEHIAKLPFAMGRVRSDLDRGFRTSLSVATSSFLSKATPRN